MKLYRIAKKAYIDDLSGEGARMYGGRWNRKGTSVIYTAENRSLATVEYLVHVPMTLIPRDTYIAELSLPKETAYDQIETTALPKHWASYPAPLALAEIGEAWVKRDAKLLLKVPSAVVREEWVILINPKHKLFSELRITRVEAYSFDKRLL